MQNYSVELSHQAEKIVRRMAVREAELYVRIAAAIDALALDPFQGKPLKGELKGRYSFRVGNYRILYEIEHHRLRVFVVDVGHRREIYR